MGDVWKKFHSKMTMTGLSYSVKYVKDLFGIGSDITKVYRYHLDIDSNPA
jgi:hypothetical protein